MPQNSVRHTAWAKLPRIGEAKNPGPEPPRELYSDRKNGQRDPIRLCTQNGVVLLLADAILGSQVRVLGLVLLLIVPHFEIAQGLVPQACLSLVQYRAVGVPVVSPAAWMRGTELERCWIDASLGVLLLLVSIEFDIVYPWLLSFGSMLCSLGTFST